ncbi:hypothetical protein AGMMS49921_14000 [Endomicrobiia bacterium]|nr:hypothetical protein AGMMS49921_14000 [Endomicrobiia bacterium]
MAVTDKEDIPSARFASEMLYSSGIGHILLMRLQINFWKSK